jgi:hypothetical protein
VLFWHLPIAEKDYAFARPSLTAHKMRELELRAGAERRVRSRSLKYKSGYHDSTIETANERSQPRQNSPTVV